MPIAALLTFCDGGSGGSSSEANNNPSASGATIFAGGQTGAVDGIGTAAGFGSLCYPVLVGDTLYVMDGGSHTLRSINKNTALVRTPIKGVNYTGGLINIGGGSHANGSGDGTAKFNSPCGIAAADASTLYVADTMNNRIRKITIGATQAATQVSDIAGSTHGDADGTGATAKFIRPRGIAISGNTLYVTDNNRIRKITIGATPATTQVTTFAGSIAGYANGVGNAAKFNGLSGIVISGNTLYVTDNAGIRTIDIATQEVGDLNAKLNAGDIASGDIAVNKTGTTLYVFSSSRISKGHLIYAVNITTKEVRTIEEIKKVTDTLEFFRSTAGIAVSDDNTLYVMLDDLILKYKHR